MSKVLEDLACHDKELSVVFTGDEKIAQLNERYLGRKGPTNVLAFPMRNGAAGGFESRMLGDVVISVDAARREAAELGETVQNRVDRLIVHGILHLLGYDHERSSAEARRMEKEEKRLLEVIGEV